MVYDGFKWSGITTTTTSTTGATNEIANSGSYYTTEYYTTNIGNQLAINSRIKKVVAKKESCELCGDFQYLQRHKIEDESLKVCSSCLSDLASKKEEKKSLLARFILWIKNLFR